MKQTTLYAILMLVLAVAILAACATTAEESETTGQGSPEQEGAVEATEEPDTPAPTEASTDTPEPTYTPTPEPSDTPVPTPSPEPTNTPEPTPTATPEPTFTPTPEPDLFVEAESINVRSGPGTEYETLGAVTQGEALVVSGQVWDCQWLLVETASGEEGWVSGSSDYVSLNLDCAAIVVAEMPPPPATSSTEQPVAPGPDPTEPPAPAGGTGRITLVNESPEYGGAVFLRTCCENFNLAAGPGETNSLGLSADEYAWGVAPHGCVRDFPQLFLTDGMEITVKLIPIDTGCGFYANVTILNSDGEIQVVDYPLYQR